MYYILTVLSGAKKHINDSPVSPLQSPHLFAMRTIKRHCTLTRHRLRDCDLEIVSRNMMHLDRAGTLSPGG